MASIVTDPVSWACTSLSSVNPRQSGPTDAKARGGVVGGELEGAQRATQSVDGPDVAGLLGQPAQGADLRASRVRVAAVGVQLRQEHAAQRLGRLLASVRGHRDGLGAQALGGLPVPGRELHPGQEEEVAEQVRAVPGPGGSDQRPEERPRLLEPVAAGEQAGEGAARVEVAVDEPLDLDRPVEQIAPHPAGAPEGELSDSGEAARQGFGIAGLLGEGESGLGVLGALAPEAPGAHLPGQVAEHPGPLLR